MTGRPFPGKAIRTRDWLAEVDAIVDSGAAYASGDLLFNPVEVTFAVQDDGISVVQSATVIDYDDQGQNLDLIFFGENPGPLGTLNAALQMSDAIAAKVLGTMTVDTWVDLGDQQSGRNNTTSAGLVIRSTDGDLSVWVAGRSAGTGTYTTERLTVKLGLLRG